VLLVSLVCLLRASIWVATSLWGTGNYTAVPVAPILATGRDHLLLYAFSYTDPEFLHNLEYFIKEAVIGDTVADHIIIVQEGADLEVSWQHKQLQLPMATAAARSQQQPPAAQILRARCSCSSRWCLQPSKRLHCL
jgi:hypothetical protein